MAWNQFEARLRFTCRYGFTITKVNLGRHEDFATKMRSLRGVAKLTTRQMSILTGLSISKISRIENGKALPTAEEFERIAGAFRLLPGVADSLAVQLDRKWRQKLDVPPISLASTFDLYANASSHISYSETLIPDVMQTPEYMAAFCERVLRRKDPRVDIAEFVSSKLARQAISVRARYSDVRLLNASVLRRPLSLDRRGHLAQLHFLRSQMRIGRTELGLIPAEAVVDQQMPSALHLFNGNLVIREYLTENERVSVDASAVKTIETELAMLSDLAVWNSEAERMIDDAIRYCDRPSQQIVDIDQLSPQDV